MAKMADQSLELQQYPCRSRGTAQERRSYWRPEMSKSIMTSVYWEISRRT
jgi:hypothetical protein